MTFFLHETRYRDLAPAADRLAVLCGVGALGANLAETLARMGLRRLRVIDRDRVEAHNLSTQPWLQQDVGAPKARVLSNALYRAVGARIDAQTVELRAENAARLLGGGAVVVDAFDNLPSRAVVGQAAAALGIACLHIALGGAGDYGCGLWDSAYAPGAAAGGDASPAPDSCDYPLTRPLAQLVAAAAAEVLVGYLLDGSRRNFECTLRDLRLHPQPYVAPCQR
jgi:molybdopterin-synthase adenylyltransferase